MDKFLYHITPVVNLSGIRKKGLLPDASDNGITTRYGTRYGKVFLTNDYRRVLATQCGSDWLEHNPVAIIRVHCDGLNIEPHRYSSGGTYTLSDFEFVTDSIPVEYLVDIMYN